MARYQLLPDGHILDTETGGCIPPDPDNGLYQDYLLWIEDPNNIPDPDFEETTQGREQLRRSEIRQLAQRRVFRDLVGAGEVGRDDFFEIDTKLIFLLLELTTVLQSKGVIAPADFTVFFKRHIQDFMVYDNAKTAAIDAISNGDSLAQFRATLNALIPPQ